VAHSWYAIYVVCIGRDEVEATRARERAQKLEPLSAYIDALAGVGLVMQGRHEEAIRECNKALEIDPGYVVALYAIGCAYSRVDRHDEAIAAYEKAATITDQAPFYLGLLGSGYAAAGRDEEARRVLATLEERSAAEYVPPLCLAWVLGALGEMDRAFAELERAYQERSGFLTYPKLTPFDPLRRDPRFRAFFQRIGPY
jgi:tetratricopeptide (TPR) repeat protein